MKRKFIAPNDPVLIKQAKPVKLDVIAEPETKQFIEQMLDVAYGHRVDRSKPTVVGLAAPQIGISRRIICVDVGADGKGGLTEMRVYINPEITWQSQDEEEWCEGCWSTNLVCGVVSRPSKIKLVAFTPVGKKVEEEHEGYVARIFMHEIDHLNGKEFVNHISDPNKLHWVEKDQWTAYKNKGGWRDWPIKCSFGRWNQIKSNKT